MSSPLSVWCQRLIARSTNIEDRELKPALVAFAFIFILMAAYYILRPVRDAMASDWSDAEVSFLWTLNFFISAAVVALYGLAVAKLKFRWLVPAVYGFFAATFLLFYLAIVMLPDCNLVDKCFYVWLSVFSLFHVSVFWSFMSDLFHKEQAKRLFAVIASGASAGALLGPLLPTLFANVVGTDSLMLVAALMLFIPLPLIFALNRMEAINRSGQQLDGQNAKPVIGGNPFAGFKLFVATPYLMAIGVFILLYTMLSSFIYFEQKNLLAEYDRSTRTQILGGVDWITNLLTFGLALFATGRLVQKFKMGVTLALLPVVVLLGLVVLAFAPLITVLLILQVARRAGNYGVTRPAREMLFTEVDRDARFKAKPVIDIVVYRGGDMVTSWIFAGLTQGLGLGLAVVSLIGAGIAALWAAVGVYLGRVYEAEKQP